MVCTKIKEIQSKIYDVQLNVDWIHLSKTKIIRLDFKKQMYPIFKTHFKQWIFYVENRQTDIWKIHFLRNRKGRKAAIQI